ncbi:unnamed protein product [Adineta ricciae]|uniref:Uncharacterized protein n=1 Tax=Adineta ricciae TaxID=249248 RepID=A0A815SXA9_ADIRI|nr:unnamed protein product [Adineta ricciae]CAF1499608.1 unnamed protein product [Adineta ricciae]
MFLNSVVVLLILLYIPCLFGHLCLWQPMQRGNFSLNPPGSHDCYRKQSPCGGFNSSTSKQRTILEADSMYTVLFQQHLNHYYPGNPGQLDISFAVGLDPPEEDFRRLMVFDDYNPMNHNTQTNFSIRIQLPSEPCEFCVLRVRYLTNNPDEEDKGTTFHQCSDIQLKSTLKKVSRPSLNQIQPIKHENDPHDCCTSPSFRTQFTHRIPDIDYISSGLIYYDKPSQQMRVTLFSMNIRYDMWMNFTSGKQYYYNDNNKTCHLFGLDYWNDWCYGNTFNQSEDFQISNTSCLSGRSRYCNQWKNGDFFFQSTTTGCYPAALYRKSNNENTIYFNPKDGPFSPDIFQPNPICLKSSIVAHEHYRAIRKNKP